MASNTPDGSLPGYDRWKLATPPYLEECDCEGEECDGSCQEEEVDEATARAEHSTAYKEAGL